MGALLIPWNPNETYKRDALLLVTTELKAPTRTHTVYKHLEVMVHPLGINLTEGVAKRIWVSFYAQDIQCGEGHDLTTKDFHNACSGAYKHQGGVLKSAETSPKQKQPLTDEFCTVELDLST